MPNERERDDLPVHVRRGSPDERDYRAGREAASRGESHTANPHPVGSRAWFAFNDGLDEARRQ